MISPRSGALLVSLGASLTLTACVSQGSSGGGSSSSSSSSSGSSGGSAAAGGSVTIGVVMATTPKSGFMGPIDSPALNAMKIEADTLNAAGGDRRPAGQARHRGYQFHGQRLRPSCHQGYCRRREGGRGLLRLRHFATRCSGGSVQGSPQHCTLRRRPDLRAGRWAATGIFDGRRHSR